MKAKDIKLGATYSVKVSGNIVPVRIVRPHYLSGWVGVSLRTGREIHIKSARRLRSLVAPAPNQDGSR